MSNEIRIYIACLAAYNNGKLHGAWIDATQDIDDIWNEISKILKSSPEPDAEEWAIHDHEGFEGLNISEYEGIESAHEKALFVEKHGELGAAVAAHFGGNIEEAETALSDHYIGEYESLEDYAREITEDSGDIPEHLAFYIDYERMGRDMEINDLFSIELGFQQIHLFYNL